MMPDPVDRVEMVIMAVFSGFLGIDVLAECGLEPGRLEVVHGQGITRKHGIGITVPDQPGKSLAGIGVKGAGRPEHPGDVAMLLFMAQQFIDEIIIHRKSRFPRTPLAEDEGIPICFGLAGKSAGMDKDPVPAVLGSPNDHPVATANISEFADLDLVLFINGDAIHAAFPGEQPLTVDFEILRENAGGMVMFRCNTILRRWLEPDWRCAVQFRCSKIRWLVGGQ